MKTIALSLLLMFTTFTVALSTYYLWQDSDVSVTMPIEEEEDHSEESATPFNFLVSSDKLILSCLSNEKSKTLLNLHHLFHYEDVYLNTPFSPPDVM